MITLQQFMETVDYKITEGGDFGWNCFGSNSHQLSAWNGIHGAGGWSANVVFSTKTQKVYCVEVCDYTNDRAYRFMEPKKLEKYNKEAKLRDTNGSEAWDDVNFVDLDMEDDWLEKAQAIVAGEEYDDRVLMPLRVEDDQLFELMKLAHAKDITLNQLIEQALREAIDKVKRTDFENDYSQDLG